MQIAARHTTCKPCLCRFTPTPKLLGLFSLVWVIALRCQTNKLFRLGAIILIRTHTRSGPQSPPPSPDTSQARRGVASASSAVTVRCVFVLAAAPPSATLGSACATTNRLLRGESRSLRAIAKFHPSFHRPCSRAASGLWSNPPPLLFSITDQYDYDRPPHILP